MSGLTFLVDTLLATRLAQRVDLVPLKGALEIAAPGAVAPAEKVSNDTRLASRAAAMQLQGGAALGGAPHAAHGDAPARPDGAVSLSMTARTLSAMVDGVRGAAPEVRGTEPLWPAKSQDGPVSSALAATLARTVADSGLFYESHLRQLAGGTRTRAQLAREPQARLGGAGAHEAWPAQPMAGTGEEEAAPVGREGPAPPSPPAQGVAPEGRLGAAGVHLDAMTLVRQQLELLAVPTFRWSGEAWAGAPMAWRIHEEPTREPEQPPRPQAGAQAQETPRTWATRLVIDLPALSEVEVRLSLAGSRLQVQLAARQAQTLALFDAQRAELSDRLGQVGLQVGSVQVQAWPPAPDAAP